MENINVLNKKIVKNPFKYNRDNSNIDQLVSINDYLGQCSTVENLKTVETEDFNRRQRDKNRFNTIKKTNNPSPLSINKYTNINSSPNILRKKIKTKTSSIILLSKENLSKIKNDVKSSFNVKTDLDNLKKEILSKNNYHNFNRNENVTPNNCVSNIDIVNNKAINKLKDSNELKAITSFKKPKNITEDFRSTINETTIKKAKSISKSKISKPSDSLVLKDNIDNDKNLNPRKMKYKNTDIITLIPMNRVSINDIDNARLNSNDYFKNNENNSVSENNKENIEMDQKENNKDNNKTSKNRMKNKNTSSCCIACT